MSASKKITLHLGKHGVKFEVVKHRKVFTAYDLAQTLGTKLENIAKTLLVKVELPGIEKKESRHYVVVVPASYRLDFGKLKKVLKATKLEFVDEKMMKKLGIEPGALTPFGSLRDFGVVVDKGLLKTKDILVGAESFTEHLRVKAKDVFKGENPIFGMFTEKNKVKLQTKKGEFAAKPKKAKKKPSAAKIAKFKKLAAAKKKLKAAKKRRVIPAKAGIQKKKRSVIPAKAGIQKKKKRK